MKLSIAMHSDRVTQVASHTIKAEDRPDIWTLKIQSYTTERPIDNNPMIKTMSDQRYIMHYFITSQGIL